MNFNPNWCELITFYTAIHSANKGNVMLHVNKIDLSLFLGQQTVDQPDGQQAS